MKIAELNGFEIHIPTSGGKAGMGCNRTSTIQLRRDSRIVRQFRFHVADDASRKAAVQKAKAFIAGITPCQR